MHTTPSNYLTTKLFHPDIPIRLLPKPKGHIQQAAHNARDRWPELADMVEAAMMLVENQSLYEMVGEPTVLALCRPTYARQGRLISLTAAGLGCTCDAWPPAIQAGPGDGLYCPDILATLLHIYLRRPLRPLPYPPEALWKEALSELQHQMTKATFNSWFAGTRAVPEASSALLLTVEVPNQYAQAWLAHRLQPVITRVVAGIAGYDLDVRYSIRTMRSDRLCNKEILS